MRINFHFVSDRPIGGIPTNETLTFEGPVYVMIHINEPLSAEARTSLENTMRKVEGVISPGLNPDKEHLLVIAYNSDKTNTTALLEKAREAGYTA